MSRENELFELRTKVRSMVAEIVCTYDRDDNKYGRTIGTILVANQHFCYLMVKRAMVSDCGSYTIYLPDGSSIKIGGSEFMVSRRGFLAGCYIYSDKLRYDITQIAAAPLGKDVVDFDEVHLCDFSSGPNPGTSFNVLGGRVLVADNSIRHDCGSTLYNGSGAPIFYDNGELAGICIQSLQGISEVLNTSTIQEHLNYIHDTKEMKEFYKKVSEFSDRSVAGD